MSERNPQATQMADESMVRGLRAQAEAIWPQEQSILDGYRLGDETRCLDLGCGTGEFAYRLAGSRPAVEIDGVDLIESHLEAARRKCAEFGRRVRFHSGDAFALEFADAPFDLAVCRHMFQAVPEPERVLQEMIRVTRAGGRLHLVSEDYGMIHFHPTEPDADRFWREGPMEFARRTGTDLRFGLRTFEACRRAGLREIAVHYATVDTVRVPRKVFREIWIAWRDGYTQAIAAHSEFTLEQVHAYWKTMIDCLDNENGYAVWQIPIVTGIVP